MKERLWVFAVLPAVVLNLFSMLLFGSYYAMQAQQGEKLALSEHDLFFLLYVVIFSVEWLFFILLLRRLKAQGVTMSSLLSRIGPALSVKPIPALFMFIVFNGLFAGYMLFVERYMGGWPSYTDWGTWQKLFMIGVVPLTAAITEEFIWRGYLLGRLLERTTAWRAILFSALSFAFIHGIMPDRLFITFLLGVVAGYYYYRQGKLFPLILSHFVLDVWSFGLTAY